MTPMGPVAIWGDKLERGENYDKRRAKDSIFNLRLKDAATDEEKTEFERYAMHMMGGYRLLKRGYPKMKEPYYTWEGRVVEKASLKGRGLPTV